MSLRSALETYPEKWQAVLSLAEPFDLSEDAMDALREFVRIMDEGSPRLTARPKMVFNFGGMAFARRIGPVPVTAAMTVTDIESSVDTQSSADYTVKIYKSDVLAHTYTHSSATDNDSESGVDVVFADTDTIAVDISGGDDGINLAVVLVTREAAVG